MRIVSYKLYPYTLHMKKPLPQKRGAYLAFTLDDRKELIGDLSPLKGFSQETLDEVISSLDSLIEKPLLTALQITPYPSLHFALSAPLFETPPSCSICPLYTSLPSPNTLFAPTVKIKVSRYPFNELLDWFKHLPSQVKVRLDFNQQSSFDELVAFSRQVNPKQIDYIEEPFSDLENLKAYAHLRLLPLALDETLRQKPFDFLTHLLPFDVAVIKPTLQKNYTHVIDRALKKGKKVVISSSFESPLGNQHLQSIASYYQLKSPQGLDTNQYIETIENESFCSLSST